MKFGCEKSNKILLKQFPIITSFFVYIVLDIFNASPYFWSFFIIYKNGTLNGLKGMLWTL
mgnify:CR=1 FL=1|jgi:hypothetical protein